MRKVKSGIVQSAMLVVMVVTEVHGRSRNVMKGHRRSFPIIRLSFQVRKVGGGVCSWLCWYEQSAMLWWPVGL